MTWSKQITKCTHWYILVEIRLHMFINRILKEEQCGKRGSFPCTICSIWIWRVATPTRDFNMAIFLGQGEGVLVRHFSCKRTKRNSIYTCVFRGAWHWHYGLWHWRAMPHIYIDPQFVANEWAKRTTTLVVQWHNYTFLGTVGANALLILFSIGPNS